MQDTEKRRSHGGEDDSGNAQAPLPTNRYRFLLGQIQAPEPFNARELRQVCLIGSYMTGGILLLNVLSAALLPNNANIDLYHELLWVFALTLGGAALSLAAATRVASRTPAYYLLSMLGIVAASFATVHGAWRTGGSVWGLNLAVNCLTIFGMRLLLPPQFALVFLLAIAGWDGLHVLMRLQGWMSSETVLPEVEKLSEGYLVALIGWRLVLTYVSMLLATYSVSRFRRSEHQLKQLNQELKQRVQTQVLALEKTNRLRRYLAPQVVTSVLAADRDPVGERSRRPISVLFCDLRGFTAMTESLSPEVIAEALNLYFDEVTKLAYHYGGTIDKFIGDAVMVFFGAPEATTPADQARRCVSLGMAIQAALQQKAEHFRRLIGSAAQVRIGIASGVATVGEFGSAYRTDYTAIGAAVNKAARLEPLAEPGTVLVDAETARLINHTFAIESLPAMKLKGFAQAEAVGKVLGPRPSEQPDSEALVKRRASDAA